MASKEPSVSSSNETTNYERLCRLLVDLGSQVLRETFDRVRPSGSLHTVLADHVVHAKLLSLRKKRVISASQWRKLYPVIKSSVLSTNFDPTLLVVLLRNICSLVPPTTGWSNLPLVTDTTPAADIVRIKFHINTVYSHASNASVDDATFGVYWRDIKDTLVRLGGAGYSDAIDDFENESMDPDFEGHYQELLKQWVEDEDSIKDKLDEDERRIKLSKLGDLEESNVNSKTGATMKDTKSLESLPRLNIKIPNTSDLPNTTYSWKIVDLPIDILLMTVEDCEFLSCFFYLDKPFKSYHKDIGYVYFGSIGSHKKRTRIALMKCSKGSADPGSSLSVVKDAVRILRPKAVFSVGGCSGLNREENKLGDVVVSSKLITPSYKTPPGRDIGALIRHIADGWKAPLENPDEQDVRVHCDGVVLSIQQADSGWQYEEIIQRYPEATAVEMEGGGVFAAAHDLKTEWVVVKGIKDYADGSQSSNDEIKTFACVMAASVVANILRDPVIFEEWPHYNPDANELPRPAVSAYTTALKASIRSQTEFQPKLMASSTIANPRTDDIFTNLLIQHGRKALCENDMTSARREFLSNYGKITTTRVEKCEEIFVSSKDGEHNPKSILLTGKAGIGKTLFSQKLIRDWADDKLFQSKVYSQTLDIKFAYLLTFRQLNLLGNERISLRKLLNYSSVLDENSNMNDSLFEYLLNHPEEVLIIIDGYDESSQQDYIAGNLEEQYPNDAREEMPVAALCAKLIKGKILRDSVVVITSRPEESEKMGGIRFDRYVEVTGFSPQQVKEYIEKYFKENKTMRNTVLEHVMNNENLVSFAHIPVLCFLMCFYLEYTLQESPESADLPVSATDIYSEVVNIFELKHNAESEYKTKEIPEEHKASDVIESTLDKLSELAAQLLLQKKAIFDEREMKERFKSEVIENLKGSCLLHCGPPFRKSAFETTKQLSFTHLTVQEFLAARWFVMRNEIPGENVSAMVIQFMAGLLSKKSDDQLMERLLESISSSNLLLRSECLSEYQDKEFAKNVVRNHPHHYSDNDGKMKFMNLNDVDCIAVSFLLDVITELNEEQATKAQHGWSAQSCNVNGLYIADSGVTVSGIKRICQSLQKEHCAITELNLNDCKLSDESVALINVLVYSKLTKIYINLADISYAGIARLCAALRHSSCKVTTLDLTSIPITDTGVANLSEALQHSNCKVTTLNLRDAQITDTGVAKLCDALQHSSCKVTTLDLSINQITDTSVAKLCDALQHPSCKVTTLDLSDNLITDTGIAKLCAALQHPSCKVTTLDLGVNQITDTGVTSLCDALQHSNCKLTSLYLYSNPISEESKESLITLVQQHRPGFKLVSN